MQLNSTHSLSNCSFYISPIWSCSCWLNQAGPAGHQKSPRRPPSLTSYVHFFLEFMDLIMDCGESRITDGQGSWKIQAPEQSSLVLLLMLLGACSWSRIVKNPGLQKDQGLQNDQGLQKDRGWSSLVLLLMLLGAWELADQVSHKLKSSRS